VRQGRGNRGLLNLIGCQAAEKADLEGPARHHRRAGYPGRSRPLDLTLR
jgi:hypothetical protein